MVLDHALLARIPDRRFSDFGREVLPEWLANGVPLFGWPLPAGTFLVDIGTPESYVRAEREWRRP
jgi:NDP-sugar pyrophosphorylase family protein